VGIFGSTEQNSNISHKYKPCTVLGNLKINIIQLNKTKLKNGINVSAVKYWRCAHCNCVIILSQNNSESISNTAYALVNNYLVC
jgi:hypothetical protein